MKITVLFSRSIRERYGLIAYSGTPAAVATLMHDFDQPEYEIRLSPIHSTDESPRWQIMFASDLARPVPIGRPLAKAEAEAAANAINRHAANELHPRSWVEAVR